MLTWLIEREQRGAVFEQARAELSALTAAAASARALAIEDAAKLVDDWVALYPLDVFPEHSTSPDGLAARVLRRMLPNVAKQIRALSPQRAAGSEA